VLSELQTVESTLAQGIAGKVGLAELAEVARAAGFRQMRDLAEGLAVSRDVRAEDVLRALGK